MTFKLTITNIYSPLQSKILIVQPPTGQNVYTIFNVQNGSEHDDHRDKPPASRSGHKGENACSIVLP